MKKSWRVLSNTYKKGLLLEALIKARGIKDVKGFLHPPHPLLCLKDFSVDFRKSLIAAKKLIYKAMEDHKPIIIHGDYDADGICATAILFNCIKEELQYEYCYPFIPSRFDHGYGFSEDSAAEALTSFSRNEKVLFITVDSGITSADEISHLRDLGHEVIVTDHHQKPEHIPNADVIVWNDLAVGASISWLLARVLGSKDTSSIGLAALATVTDVQPVLGFNRSILKTGLTALSESPPPGLKKLLTVSGVYDDKELTTYELGWVIGPRINASGRLKNAYDPLRLLISQDVVEMEEIANRLNKINIDRQEKTAEMYVIANEMKLKGKRFLLSASEKYHEGIIGLVAGKLVKDYYLPSIVIALSDDVGKGSVRSIPGIDIISTLREFPQLFLDLGGHPMAAGFTIKKTNIKTLEKKLRVYFDKNFADPAIYIPELVIDSKLPLNLVTNDLLKDIEVLKPFGIGNEGPVFLSEQVGLADKKLVGKEKNHLSMRFSFGNKSYKGIFFNADDYIKAFSIGDKVDIVYSVRKSSYSGEAELILKDLKISV